MALRSGQGWRDPDRRLPTDSLRPNREDARSGHVASGRAARETRADAIQLGKGFLLTARQTADKTHHRNGSWRPRPVTSPRSSPRKSRSRTKPIPITPCARRWCHFRYARTSGNGGTELLLFNVGDLAGFHVDGVLRGRGLMLSDRPSTAIPANPLPNPITRRDAVPPYPAARRSRTTAPISRSCVQRDRRTVRHSDHGIGAVADRRSGRIPDHGGCQGARSGTTSGGAMAALWRRRLSADGRYCKRRRLDDHAGAVARGARQHRQQINFKLLIEAEHRSRRFVCPQ